MSHWLSKIDRAVLLGWSIVVAIALVSITFNITAFGIPAPFWGVMLFTALVSVPIGALRSRDFLSVWGVVGVAFIIAYVISTKMGLFGFQPAAIHFLVVFPIFASLIAFTAFDDDNKTKELIKKEREERLRG